MSPHPVQQLSSFSNAQRLIDTSLTEGRLQQATLDLLSGSDIQFRRETRLDIALVKNHDIALVFLPAADIPTFVGEGRVDLGITGRDQVVEHEAISPATKGTGVEEVLDLGFGRCRLQVQVPEKGKIREAKELVGKNVVTSFVGLTERYFEELEGLGTENGVVNGDVSKKNKLKTKIKYVGGSVEAACALGVADGIVDLVGEKASLQRLRYQTGRLTASIESGETMKAAGLKAIDTVVESTAVLIKSKHPSNQKLVDLIASRISGVISELHPSFLGGGNLDTDCIHQLRKSTSCASTTSTDHSSKPRRRLHRANERRQSRR